MVEVYVDDRSGYWDDTLSLMRFYPQQAVDLGTSLEWSFDASAGNEIGQIGVSVTASGDPSTFSYDYVKNPTRGWNAPGEYVKLGHLFVEYNQGAQWGGATSNGAIVLAVRDDYAHDYSYGHLIYIKLVFTLVWESGTDFIHDYEVKKTVEFILGDDIDPATDSNLYLRPGYTDGS